MDGEGDNRDVGDKRSDGIVEVASRRVLGDTRVGRVTNFMGTVTGEDVGSTELTDVVDMQLVYVAWGNELVAVRHRGMKEE